MSWDNKADLTHSPHENVRNWAIERAIVILSPHAAALRMKFT
ncbi:MAG TPA: hypothetical protein VFE47_22400 [Tepidisphaeraceae bacterium]|jgi:hypothetical protein|nr:hypothetical protein [Tepidisphaeraceae bacterium]